MYGMTPFLINSVKARVTCYIERRRNALFVVFLQKGTI